MQTGSCQCGKVQYQSEGKPVGLYVCHCRECQKQSASAFGISLRVPRAGIRVIKGTPISWSRLADSGRTVKCFFCPDCGTRLWHEKPEVPEFATLKGGALNEPLDLTHAVHIWVKRKLPGIVIPEHARQFLEEPV